MYPLAPRSSNGLVNVPWEVLHCNRRIRARERRQLILFQVPFPGPGKSIEIRLRMCGPPLQSEMEPVVGHVGNIQP